MNYLILRNAFELYYYNNIVRKGFKYFLRISIPGLVL